jgi:hypothetical protein
MKIKFTITDDNLNEQFELNEEVVNQFIETSDLFDKLSLTEVLERIVVRGVQDVKWRKNDLNKRLELQKIERKERKERKMILGL